MHDGSDEDSLTYESFGEAVEAVETEIADMAERIGVAI
jgi:hypothetical protein